MVEMQNGNTNQQKNFLSELKKMTKKTLYNLAQAVGIRGRSSMSKSQLVDALEENGYEIKPMVNSIQKETPHPNPVQKKTPIVPKEIPSKPPVQSEFTESQPIPSQTAFPLPEEKRKISQESISSSSSESVPVKEPESGTVWGGEEGPELPPKYGETILRALVRDPHWIYLYWEISEDTKDKLRGAEGEWIFDISESVLRVYAENQELIQEIPVLLDAMNWYISLQANRTYEFQLGLKGNDGAYHLLASSNPVTLPPDKPSEVEDEEWTVVEEQFSEMLQTSGGLDITSWGGSADVMPHILRNRIRVPWNLPSSFWPSSHLMGVSSSTVQRQR